MINFLLFNFLPFVHFQLIHNQYLKVDPFYWSLEICQEQEKKVLYFSSPINTLDILFLSYLSTHWNHRCYELMIFFEYLLELIHVCSLYIPPSKLNLFLDLNFNRWYFHLITVLFLFFLKGLVFFFFGFLFLWICYLFWISWARYYFQADNFIALILIYNFFQS